MEESPLIRITIDIPEDLRKSLRMACAIHGINMRKLVMQAIKEKIDKLETK